MKTGLTVIAYVTAKVGQEDEVRNALLDLVACTRDERGCVNYNLHQSDATPVKFQFTRTGSMLPTSTGTLSQAMCGPSEEKWPIAWNVLLRSRNGRMVSELGQHGEC